MKRSLLIIAISVISLLVFTSCARGGVSEVMPTPMPTPVPTPVPAPTPPITITTPSAPGDVYKEGGAGALPSTPKERMIVRTGDMSLVVEDVVDARDKIAQLATKLGGWVVSSNIYGEQEELTGSISIRVPDETFDQAFTELRGLAVRVTSESTNSEDITEEYVDLQSRLRNAEATENEYLALLEKATKVEDALNVYQALTQIRSEIEQIKGRMQYLERTSAMSLISVDLKPVATAKPLISPTWSAREAAKSAVRGLTAFGQGLGTAAIGAGIFSPIWGTILGVLLWRRRRKRKA
jgi:hypothetical protein